MPLTQTRMVALILAARALQTALDDTARRIIQEWTDCKYGKQTPQDALDHISLLCSNPSATVPEYARHLATIAAEEAHFRATRSRNDSARRSAARRRRDAGIPQLAPSPSLEHIAQRLLQAQVDRVPSLQLAQPIPISQSRNAPDFVAALSPDPDDFLSDSFASPNLTPEQKAALDLEIELFNAPPGHSSQLSTNGQIWCECGHRSGVAQWRLHLPPTSRPSDT